MKVTIEKCEQCGKLFEDSDKYNAHIKTHNLITVINGAFPKVKDKGCCFANGDWNVQRTEEWLHNYKQAIIEAVDIKDFPPFSYGWYRCLDDGGSMYYGPACRMMNVCPICFLEWGQPYYANNCNHVQKAKQSVADSTTEGSKCS